MRSQPFPAASPVLAPSVSAALLRAGRPPLAISHRGASAAAPENTMAGFLLAWESGAPWLEADVQPTSDNVPVMFHDQTLDRTTDGTGSFRDQTAHNLRALDAGSWFVVDGRRPFAGARIPELAEVLATLGPDRSMLLEIKGEHSRDEVLAVLEVCRASGFDDRVLLESFEIDALRHVRSIQPDRPVALLVHELHEDPVAICRELGAVSYNPDHLLLRDRPEVVEQLHRAGLAVQIWTADDPADWRALTDLGVDGIVTNVPAELVAWQRAHARSVAR